MRLSVPYAVDGFTVRGLSCRNFRWWALNFLFCAHGRLTDLDFLANDAAVGGDGRPYRGLCHDRYDEILVKNADGIDLRRGFFGRAGDIDAGHADFFPIRFQDC